MTRALHRFLLTLVLALAAALVAPVAAAQMKVSVVDMQRAVTESEEGLRAHARLKKLFERRQRELDARQETLQRAREEIEKQAKVLSREALDRRQEEWRQSMMELQAVFVEFNRELQKSQSEATQPMVGRVYQVLRQIASQEGYDAILEKTAVPYARTDLDITDKVIQIYNQTYPAPAETSAERPAAPRRTPPAKPAGSK